MRSKRLLPRRTRKDTYPKITRAQRARSLKSPRPATAAIDAFEAEDRARAEKFFARHPEPPPANPIPQNRLIDGDSAHRKNYPLFEGLIAYFPDALAYVAHVSKRGNDKHNHGQPLHHARSKSGDHADCVARHLLNHGGFDEAGVRESGGMAWRALALLQEELERDLNLPLPRGAKDLTKSGGLPPR